VDGLPKSFGTEFPDNLRNYVQLLVFGKKTPVTEIWSSQRSALPLVLDLKNQGAVITLRTSAGKTLVAELAILQTLIDNPTSKVLYLAPFDHWLLK
jgi:replicative superfamily II helicase